LAIELWSVRELETACARMSPVGRVAYQVLAGLAPGESSSSYRRGARTAEELYRGAPYGVGYFAGVWHP